MISAYRDVVREMVVRHDGHVDQFQGDGVVAYFGFPVTGEDDQLRAVEAGQGRCDIVREIRKPAAASVSTSRPESASTSGARS